MNPLSGLLELGSTLIDRLIPDKAQQAEAKLKLLEMQQQGELQQLQTRMSAILAEAQSSDPWTSRARPMFMYVFYVLLLFLVIIAPLVGVLAPSAMSVFFANVKAGFQAIPEELWWTFSAGYLGYAGVRGYEKVKGAAK